MEILMRWIMEGTFPANPSELDESPRARRDSPVGGALVPLVDSFDESPRRIPTIVRIREVLQLPSEEQPAMSSARAILTLMAHKDRNNPPFHR